MDRRTTTAVVLALAVYWVWITQFSTPAVPEVDAAAVEDTVLGAASSGVTQVDGGETQEAPDVTAGPPDPAAPPMPMAHLPVQTGTFAACGVEMEWTTDGGRISDVIFDDYQAAFEVQPIWKWLLNKARGDSSPWSPYGAEPGLTTLGTGAAEFLAMGSGELGQAATDATVIRSSADELVLRGLTTEGVEVEKRLYVHTGDDETCTLGLDVSWKNTTNTTFSDGVWLSLHDEMPGSAGRYGNAVRPFAMADGDYETWPNLDKLTKEEPMEGRVDWLALADGYFTMALIPTGEDTGTAVFAPVQRGDLTKYGVYYRIPGSLAAGETHNERFNVYVGVKDHGTLKALAPGLHKLVQLGWFAFFGRILLFILHLFHGVLGNWGLSIIALTVFVKGIFFPLTQASFRSSQAMQAIQPKLAKIREDYKDNPEELNRKTMAMFKENGVNPVAGCLPMFIQLPVWISLYNLLLSSVDIYHVEFLYLKDLTSVDPYAVLPFVVVCLMLVQQQFMPTGNMDPTQARMMKLMPLIFGFFFFTFPSGLVIYIFVNMLLTILQQWWIKRSWSASSAAAIGSENG